MRGIVLVLMGLMVVDCNQCYKVLIGRTRNGKSYIADKNGCPSSTCPGKAVDKSCTQSAVVCDDIIDSVGDDHTFTMTVEHKGQLVNISGFSYPAYDLVKTLAEGKITCVQFFHVKTAGNLVEGASSQAMRHLVHDQLKCPVTTIYNMYRANEFQGQLKPGDITVEFGQQHIKLEGPSCEIAIDGDWVDHVINNDFESIRSRISIKQCDEAVKLKADIQSILNTLPRAEPEEVVIPNAPYPECKRTETWNNCGSDIVGICTSRNKGSREYDDDNCIKSIEEQHRLLLSRYDEDRRVVLEYNEKLRAQQTGARSEMAKVNEKLAVCQHLANANYY